MTIVKSKKLFLYSLIYYMTYIRIYVYIVLKFNYPKTAKTTGNEKNSESQKMIKRTQYINSWKGKPTIHRKLYRLPYMLNVRQSVCTSWEIFS